MGAGCEGVQAGGIESHRTVELSRLYQPAGIPLQLGVLPVPKRRPDGLEVEGCDAVLARPALTYAAGLW